MALSPENGQEVVLHINLEPGGSRWGRFSCFVKRCLLLTFVCSSSEAGPRCPGAPHPAWVVYHNAWRLERGGQLVAEEELNQKLMDLSKLVESRTTGLMTDVFQDFCFVKERDDDRSDDAWLLHPEIVRENAKHRAMFPVTSRFSEISGETLGTLEKMNTIDLKSTGCANAPTASIPLPLLFFSHEIAKLWSGRPDNWLLEFLDHLLRLPGVISYEQLQINYGQLMHFREEHAATCKRQYFHLDLPWEQIYKHLSAEDRRNLASGSTFDDSTCYLPAQWLLLAPLGSNYKIHYLKSPMGIQVMRTESTEFPIKTSGGYFLETPCRMSTLSIPFGAIVMLAGSVIHAGDGPPVPYSNLFRLHAFCHFTGHGAGLGVDDTFLYEYNADPEKIPFAKEHPPKKRKK